MSDKSGFGSSLFAGMNLGRSKTSDNSDKAFTSSSESDVKSVLEEDDETSSKESADNQSGETISHGSSFGFITNTKAQQEKQTDEMLPGNSSVVINLFDKLGEGETSDDQLSLSYSEQLAEILPSVFPLNDTLLPTNSEEGCPSEDDTAKYEISNDIDDDDNDKEANCEAPDDSCSTADNTGDVAELNTEHLKNTTCTRSDYMDVVDMTYVLELDPEENIALFYSQHSFKLTKLREERAEMQHNICTFYKDVKCEMLSLEDKLSNLKRDFERALSNDEYDLAAELNDHIEEVNTKKIELECSRPKLLDQKIEEFFNCVAALRQHEKEFHQWSLTKYEDLEKQQNGLLAKHKQQCSNEINNKKQELAHHKNQINRSLQHLQLDKEHLIKDRTDLDDEIDSKLEVFQNRKKELVSEQVEIDEKIEILKKQLKRLQKEKKEVEFSIQDQDDKMAAVRKEFESMGKKLNERCDEIKSEEQLLNNKLEDISAKEKELDKTAAQEQEKEESLVKTIHYLTTNKKESEAFIETSEKEPTIDLEIYLTRLPHDHGDNLMKLKRLEKAKAKELQDLELQVFNQQQVISTKTKRLNEIKNQIPDLESTKKCAASEHNFKEAKRANEMIKQLVYESEILQRDLECTATKLDENKRKTEVIKRDYNSIKDDVMQGKDHYGLAGILRNVNKAHKLMETRVGEDSLLDTLHKEEMDLLKMEFTFLQVPSKNILSTMGDDEKKKMNFMQELIEEGNILTTPQHSEPDNDYPLI